jgi:glycosyltransferase involved in cell wall biosynthesis
MKISIIIPCWRDATALVKLVDRLRNTPDTQWIAVLVNPDRSTVAGLERKGVECFSFPWPNRGAQMNRGAQLATGDVLLFHHVDSQLTLEHLESLREAMAISKVIGGAFYRKFDERHPCLRWAEPAERWRCRHWGALFGDQSLFVRKEIFVQLGGFADIPLMEDVEFSKRLRQNGFIVLLDPHAFFLRRENIWRKEAGEPLSEILPFWCCSSSEYRRTTFIGGITDNARKVPSSLLRAASDHVEIFKIL